MFRSVLRNPFSSPFKAITQAGEGGQSLDSAILALFANGEQGAWLSLRDDNTLFTDAARTTPAAAGGQIGGITDKSGNGAHAAQATASFRPGWPATGPARIRTDFVDDVLHCTLGADCEVWVNTPNGHYRTVGHAGYFTLPLNDCTDFVAVGRELTVDERASLAAYFGTPERWGCYLRDSTSVTLSVWNGPAQTIDFVGANGVSVSKSVLGISQVIDTSLDGLTAPIMVMPRMDYSAGYFWIWNQGVAGSVPLPVAPITYYGISYNKLTGSIPDANAAMEYYYVGGCQFTGRMPSLALATGLRVVQTLNNKLNGAIPDLSAFTALTNCDFGVNNFTSWAGGSVSATLGYFNAYGIALPQPAIDGLLAAFVAAGRTSASGQVRLNLGGSTNAAPSAAGLVDKATLVSRGWDVKKN